MAGLPGRARRATCLPCAHILRGRCRLGADALAPGTRKSGLPLKQAAQHQRFAAHPAALSFGWRSSTAPQRGEEQRRSLLSSRVSPGTKGRTHAGRLADGAGLVGMGIAFSFIKEGYCHPHSLPVWLQHHTKPLQEGQENVFRCSNSN